MNATARTAVMSACLSNEQCQVEVAEASTTAHPAPDQIFPAGSDHSAQLAPKGPVDHRPPSAINAAPELGISKDITHHAVTPEAKEGALEAGIDDTRPALLKVASERVKFREGEAAARALFASVTGGAAETSKYREGAAAAKALFDKVAGSPADGDLSKYAAGRAAALKLLGRTERPSAA
jgi:hypothetical protein